MQGTENPQQFELSSGSVTIRGEQLGDGEAVLLLHGLTATRRYVVMGSKLLAKEGHRMVAYDARGHGESDSAPERGAYEYSDLVGDLARCFERALRSLDPVPGIREDFGDRSHDPGVVVHHED